MANHQGTIRRLREAGIRPSAPRIAILEYVQRVRCHPSAETVHHALQKGHPSLSLTTVYNTLRLFAETGLAVQLDLGCNEARFDGFTAPHGHFRCRACGKIYDVLEAEMERLPHPAGFLVESASLSYSGLCPSCTPVSGAAICLG